MHHKLREKYRAGEPVIGTFFNLGDPSAMECLGYTELDYVIIDCEHGPFDTETMMDLIRAAEGVGLTPVVRIAGVDHREIQRAADCGAEGLIVPCLRTVDEYRRLIDLAKYAPTGNRGFIKGRGCGFGNRAWASGSLEEFMANSNEKLMVIPQCETAESLEHIEEIAALEGLDGIFVGPFDLSISMGIPARFEHPDFLAALERIYAACRAADKPVYVYTNDAAESRRRLASGIAGVACSLNSVELIKVYRQLVQDIGA